MATFDIYIAKYESVWHLHYKLKSYVVQMNAFSWNR